MRAPVTDSDPQQPVEENASAPQAPTDTTPNAEAPSPEETGDQTGGNSAPNGDSTKSTESHKKGVGGLVSKHGPLVAACVLSLTAGFSVAYFIPNTSEPVVEIESEDYEWPHYVASIERRKEPIGPLVPFHDLDQDVVALGRKIFHDQAISGTGRLACVSCHKINEGGDDGLPVAIGIDGKEGVYNTPSVLNAGLNYVQFWDGRARTLEQQLDFTLDDPVHFNSSWDRVATYMERSLPYSRAFQRHFGGKPTPARIRRALASYMRSLITVDSKFDRWLAGDENILSANELTGYYLFQKLNCVTCHQSDTVGGSMFQPLGKMKEYFADQRELTDADLGRYNVTHRNEDRYVFRVPSLRTAELTAPYFHDGSVEKLEKAVEIMMRYQVGIEDPNPDDIRRITLFLKTLTGTVPNQKK